jgi:hypothetical protein
MREKGSRGQGVKGSREKNELPTLNAQRPMERRVQGAKDSRGSRAGETVILLGPKAEKKWF